MKRTSELDFLKRAYRSYYFRRVESVEVPEEIERREFGILSFEGTMIRHLACANAGELKALLVRESPRSAYCSVAYYESPQLPIEEKGLLKADMAFDIDSGDLELQCKDEHDFKLCDSCRTPHPLRAEVCPSCGSTRLLTVHLACNRCIGAAKEEVVKLQDFLERDFGVAPSQIRPYFSGNRGFHVSVVGSKYENVDQGGRAEMVDYISGKGFTARQLGLSPKRGTEELYFKLPTPEEPGWRGRVASAFQDATGMNARDVLLKSYAEDPASFSSLLAKTVEKLSVKVDSAVTTDMHRVFRLGGTLHDKSGLIKRRYANVMDADPFVDSVAFGSDLARVDVAYSPKFTMMAESFGPFRGERTTLPMYAAVYLVSKGLARPTEDP
jgi:DNA primase small subunit